MPATRLVVTRRLATDRLRCYLAHWDVQPGEVVLDPNEQRVEVVATEEQLLGTKPAPQGVVRPAPASERAETVLAQALDVIPPFPFLNSVVLTPAGPARLVRVRARGQIAVLALPDGEIIEQPLAVLRRSASSPDTAEEPPC